MAKTADKDTLETLALLEFQAEMASPEGGGSSIEAQAVTTFRRIVREAGYSIPDSFDWMLYADV